jgi:hypothetical protein
MNTQTSNTPRIDWSVLSNSLIVLTFTVIVSILLIVGSQQYDTSELKQCQDFNKQQAATSRYRETLGIVGNNPVHYDTNSKQLIKDGFFQEKRTSTIEEQRLKMMAEIESIISRLLLPTPASYELTQPTPYTVPNFTIANQFKVYETKLTLKLGLLHEEDVLELIERIDFQQLPGLFNWQKCEIKRTTDKINVKDASKANFEAICVLAWYVSTIEPDSK